MKLPCKECVQTDNHCCLADIPFEITTGLALIQIGKKAGFNNIYFDKHPKFDNKIVLFNRDWIENGDIDLEGKPCVFFKDGQCGIYDDRPDICRLYGTEYIRCRYECAGISTKEEIEVLNMRDIQNLDNMSREFSSIGELLK